MSRSDNQADRAPDDAHTTKINDEHFPTIGIDVKAEMKHTAGLGWTFEVRLHALGPDDVMVSESDVFDSKRDCAYALMGEFQDRIAKLWKEYNE